MEDRVRSFIAVAIPSASAERLRVAQERLREAEPRIKWVNPDGFHITLKFLGGVGPSRLRALWSGVCEALEGVAGFTMHFQGIGAFPSLSRARVVWAGVTDGAAELTEIAKRIEHVSSEHEFEPETRPFAAHMTLGRAREPAPNPVLAEAMREMAGAELGRVTVDRVLLMKSELTRQGAIYHELEHKLLQ
ncbi:MAG: RNA 2',3'-cyclic phosphodiesterase [Armatimonadota bacterium]|jgi:2'-5' RNA ligase